MYVVAEEQLSEETESGDDEDFGQACNAGDMKLSRRKTCMRNRKQINTILPRLS